MRWSRPAALHTVLASLVAAAVIAAGVCLATGRERAAFHLILWPCVAAYAASRPTR